jgi:hypothetical protein
MSSYLRSEAVGYLKHSDATAYKAAQVPELKAAIDSGRLSVCKARAADRRQKTERISQGCRATGEALSDSQTTCFTGRKAHTRKSDHALQGPPLPAP